MPRASRRVACLLSLGLLGACSAGMRPRPSAREACRAPSPASERSPCVLDTTSGRFQLFASADATNALARVADWHSVDVRFSEPSPADPSRPPRARAVLGDNDFVRFSGWASLDDVSFWLRRAVDVVPGHVWLRPGALVRVLGAQDGGVLVTAGGECSDESYRVVVSCADLGGRDAAGERSDEPAPHGRRIWPTGHVVDLLHAPRADACSLHRIEGARIPMYELERRDEHVRVGGGGDLRFDGWAPADQLTDTEPQLDGDSCCGPPDENDRCPAEPSRMTREAPVRVGASPDGPELGVAVAGASVDVVDRRPGFAAVVSLAGAIVAPEGERFWVPEEAIAPDPSSDDGCP